MKNKHQKIYELSGVEPDYHYDETEDNVYIGGHNVVAEIEEFPQLIPYYPLEQVLRELPERLEDGKWLLTMSKDSIFYESWADNRHEVEPLYLEINKDLHQAALRLWLKVLEDNK